MLLYQQNEPQNRERRIKVATIILTNKTAGLDTDSRFRRWGKLIRSADDVDLSAKNGYSLTGPWVRWDEAVALAPGQFLVAAGMTGSRRNCYYIYSLIDHEGRVLKPDAPEVKEVVETLPDDQKAKALNSTLYAFAAYAAQRMRSSADRRQQLEAEAEALRQRLAAIEAELAKLAEQ
jgi:hypothetical protein